MRVDFRKLSNKINIGMSKGRMITILLFLLLSGAILIGCRQKEPKELLIGAAASLEPAMEEIKGLYVEENPEVTLSFTYASSGDLEKQIRQGAPINVFISAAQKQMDSLEEDGLIVSESREDLLTNEIVLVVPGDSTLGISGFEDITKAGIIAIGDPESVPAGQYAKEILDGLGIWDEVLVKSTLGKSVTEVLSWVSSGNADAGIVYRTDAASNDGVSIIETAPEGSYTKPVYPVSITSSTEEKAAAEDLINFLNGSAAEKVFVDYGFGITD